MHAWVHAWVVWVGVWVGWSGCVHGRVGVGGWAGGRPSMIALACVCVCGYGRVTGTPHLLDTMTSTASNYMYY